MKMEILKVAVPNLRPWFYTVTENNVTRLEGTEKFLVPFLMKRMSIWLQILESKEDAFGRENGPGNWTGAIGMLIRGEADIMIGMYSASSSLFPYVGFSTCVEASTFGVLSGPASVINQELGSFLSSVNTSVWIILFFSWILISLISYLFARIEITKLKMAGNGSEVSLVGSFLAHYGLLFERGFIILPESNGRRLMLAGWLILSEVLMSAISGTFSSKLAVLDVPEQIDKLEDLLKYKQICPFLTKGIVVDTYIQNSKNPVDNAIWANVLKCDSNREMHEYFSPKIMNKVNEGKASLIGNREYILTAIANNDCRRKTRPLYMSKESFLSLPIAYLYRKSLSSHLAEAFSSSMVTYAASGMSTPGGRLTRRDAAPCFRESLLVQKSVSDLGIKDLIKVFQLWGILLGLATTFFAGELLFVIFPGSIIV